MNLLGTPFGVETRGSRRVRRLAAIDWLLIGTLLPLCVFGVVMSVVHGVRGKQGWSSSMESE